MILVSSCLLGLNCRYDGQSKKYPAVSEFLEGKKFLAVCPEQMGGLATPRYPAEIFQHDPLVIRNSLGEDVTELYINGVNQVMKLIDNQSIHLAILKSRSPSCGSSHIYDGSFTKHLVEGEGVLVHVLKAHDIQVINEEQI